MFGRMKPRDVAEDIIIGAWALLAIATVAWSFTKSGTQSVETSVLRLSYGIYGCVVAAYLILVAFLPQLRLRRARYYGPFGCLGGALFVAGWSLSPSGTVANTILNYMCLVGFVLVGVGMALKRSLKRE
jgi:hypothetical protein